jgi:hypothetical protein
MADTLTPLVIDFLEWLVEAPRPYAEVMEAWRTSCPRLTVWEDATDNGFVTRRPVAGGPTLVELTACGREFLAGHLRMRLGPQGRAGAKAEIRAGNPGPG